MSVRRPSFSPVGSSYQIEPLESRQYLTVLTGGDILEYKDAGDATVRIQMHGNITAEFIWALVDEETNAVTLTTSPTPPGEDADPDDDIYGADLFAIYVSNSDQDASIVIARVPDPGEGTGPRAMQPYEGSIGSIRIIDAQEGESITVSAPEGSGEVLLGARTRDIDGVEDGEDSPITAVELDDNFGEWNSGDILTAGLTVANGNDLGGFLFGGTVTGRVLATGSIDTFYAGWIVTGTTSGQFPGDPNVANNFRVMRDLRNLIAVGIGTDAASGEPSYLSGFDLKVNGSVGQIKTLGDFAGSFNILNDQAVDSLGGPHREVEFLLLQGDPFQQGRLSMSNDTFEEAQYLNPQRVKGIGPGQHVRVAGTIQGTQIGDLTDYYAVGLMGGQTYTVRLKADFPGNLMLGVFDPDGRLITSEYGHAQPGEAFRFTADKPGAYRFAIGISGDIDFDGSVGLPFAAMDYVLQVRKVGRIGLGGFVVGGNAYDGGQINNPAFKVKRGDFGGVAIGGSLFAESRLTFVANNGRLRSLVAGGDITGGDFGMPSIKIPRNSVGRIAAGGNLSIATVANQAIGGDLQMVQAGGTLYLNIEVNRAIGSISAGDMATLLPSILTVNADGIDRDGVIDLIDVTGNFGTLNSGGPQISTGLGGNVRYIRVGGTIYRDSFFGGGEPDGTLFSPGESVTFNDDSGSRIRLTPLGQPNPDYNPFLPIRPPTPPNPNDPEDEGDPGNFPEIAATLNVITYGIRGSGGVVVVRVEVDGGIAVRTTGAASDATAEISEIIINSEEPIEARFSGTATTDVYRLTGEAFTSISNSTDGEMVSIEAASIDRLRAETLGLAKSSTGADLAAGGFTGHGLNDTYPFANQQYGIAVSGDLLDAAARRALGNFMVSGNVGSLVANSDGKLETSPNLFEGIAAPIYVGGNLDSVRIGEGIAPSGTGAAPLGGLFVEGLIGTVRNTGSGSNIRGNIISLQGIDRIALTNGSIINASIMVVSEFEMARAGASGITIPNVPDPVNAPNFDIGSITLTGNGGIIGSRIAASDVGQVTVKRGFGILGSSFIALGDGRIQGFNVDGYGMRNVYINAGASMGAIKLNGGKSVATDTFSAAVRYSEKRTFDRFFGTKTGAYTDIHAYLGTSADETEITGVTDTGIMQSVTAVGGRDFSGVDAHRIRGNTQINFANSIGTIKARKGIDGLSVTTGQLTRIEVGGNTRSLDMTVAGPISNAILMGNYRNSQIRAVGPNGEIKNITVFGDVMVDSSILVRGTTGKIVVRGDLLGTLTIEATRADNHAADLIELHGAVADGAINIEGNVDKFVVLRDFGTDGGGEAIIDGNVGLIHLGSLQSHNGAKVRINLVVTGNVDQYTINGQVDSDLRVEGNLKSLLITADAGSDESIVNGTFSILGKLDKAIVEGGDIAANIEVGNDITSFIIRNGDLEAVADIISLQGDILLVRAENGRIFGRVLAPNGTVGVVEESPLP